MRPSAILAMSLLAVMFTAACQGRPEGRTVSIAVTVPDPAWSVRIETIYEANGQLLVLSRLSRDPELMAAQVISTIRDQVTAPLPAGDVVHLVAGRTWNWGDDEHRFVTDEEARKAVAQARRVFVRPR